MTDSRRPASQRQYRGSVSEQSNATSRGNQLVGIEEAPGLALGRDGDRHPIEVNRSGELAVEDVTLKDVFERLGEVVELLTVIAQAID